MGRISHVTYKIRSGSLYRAWYKMPLLLSSLLSSPSDHQPVIETISRMPIQPKLISSPKVPLRMPPSPPLAPQSPSVR